MVQKITVRLPYKNPLRTPTGVVPHPLHLSGHVPLPQALGGNAANAGNRNTLSVPSSIVPDRPTHAIVDRVIGLFVHK